jgi:hypothetical protein
MGARVLLVARQYVVAEAWEWETFAACIDAPDEALVGVLHKRQLDRAAAMDELDRLAGVYERAGL